MGAGCFALFWTLQPTSLDESVPWLFALALHATSAASLAIGLGLVVSASGLELVRFEDIGPVELKGVTTAVKLSAASLA